MQNFGNEETGLTDEQLEQYLALLTRMYERMARENSWPWLSHKNSSRAPDQQQVQDPTMR